MGPAVTIKALCAPPIADTGDVARSNHHREPHTKLSLIIVQRVLVLDLDRDVLAGADVGDRSRKDVRAFLFYEAGLSSFRFSLFVGLLRFASLFDHAIDDALADAHGEMIDGGMLGQWKHIDAFRPFGGVVFKLL